MKMTDTNNQNKQCTKALSGLRQHRTGVTTLPAVLNIRTPELDCVVGDFSAGFSTVLNGYILLAIYRYTVYQYIICSLKFQ